MTTRFIWIISALHLNFKTNQLLEVLNLCLFLILKTYFRWILSVSHLKSHTTLKLNFFLNSRDNWMTPTYHQQMFSLDTMTMKCSYCKKEIDAPHDNINHHVLHACEEQDQNAILTHATILSHTFALPQFMDQDNYEYQEPTDTPNTVPTAFQVSCDHALHRKCAHNPMSIQCNQYPNLSHNLALSNFWHNTILKTCVPLTLQVQYQPLSKLRVTTHTTLSALINQWKPSATNHQYPT